MSFLRYFAKYASETALIQYHQYYIVDNTSGNYLLKIAMRRNFMDLYQLLANIVTPTPEVITSKIKIRYPLVKYPLFMDMLVNKRITIIANLLDLAIYANSRPVIEHLMNLPDNKIKNPTKVLEAMAAIGDPSLFDLVYSVEQPKSSSTNIRYEMINPDLLERIEKQLEHPLEIYRHYLIIGKPIDKPNTALISHMFDKNYSMKSIVGMARKLPNEDFGAIKEDQLHKLYHNGLIITPDILFELIRNNHPSSAKRYKFLNSNTTNNSDNITTNISSSNNVYLKPEHMFLCHYDVTEYLRFINPALIHLRDSRGYNLFNRLEYDSRKSVKAMCDMGIDVNNVNNSKITPLMVFIKSGKHKSAKILINYNANVNAINTQKRSALDYAKTVESIAVLLDGGIKHKEVAKKLKTVLGLDHKSDILYRLAISNTYYRPVFRACLRYGLPNQKTPTTFTNQSFRRLYYSLTSDFNPEYYSAYSRDKQLAILTMMQITRITEKYIPYELLCLIFSNL